MQMTLLLLKRRLAGKKAARREAYLKMGKGGDVDVESGRITISGWWKVEGDGDEKAVFTGDGE